MRRASCGSSTKRRTAATRPSASSTCCNAPASRSIALISRKLNTCGPISTGSASAAGSNGLCPPVATRLPPTKAISARAYRNSSSPMVSPSSTWARAVTTSPVERRTVENWPAHSSCTVAKRSGWRGTSTNSASLCTFSSCRWASRINPSSPSWVLAAIQIGRWLAPTARATVGREASTGRRPSGRT